jgi:hypothetical protein
MATKKTPNVDEPVTVNIPTADTPPEVELNELTPEDFAKTIRQETLSKPRTVKPVGKRPTVEQELARLREELQRNTAFLGVIACAKDPWGGQLILLNKDSVIDKWIDVCRINPTIRRALLSAMDMGVYATAITSTLALVIAFLAHANMLPNSEMLLVAVGGTGVTLPTDEQVEMTKIMFGMDENTNGNSGS